MGPASLQVTATARALHGAQLDRFLSPDRQSPWAGRVPDHGSLTLIGHPGSGVEEAVKRIAAAERAGAVGLWLDARLYGDRDAFVHALIQQLLEQLLGAQTLACWRLGEPPSRDVLGSLGSSRAAEIARLLDPSERPSSLAQVLALADRLTLGITWAHLLTERSMGRLLWELRASVAATDGNTALILATFPATRDLLLGRDAPLFGVGQQLDVTDPTTSRWRELVRIHDLPVTDEDLLWLLLRTDGQARTTAEILELTRTADRDAQWVARESWERLAEQAAARMSAQLTLARAITPHGPALIAAIAAGRGPYSALAAHASPKQISRSLSQLAYHGVIYSPRPRLWLLAEPLLRDAVSQWHTLG